MKFEDAILLIKQELKRAEQLHPVWPDCMARKAAYVCEEAMELLQSANNYEDNKLKPNVYYDNMETEAVHTAVTAIRFLINM